MHAVVSQPVPAERSSSATVVSPNASRTRSSSLGSGSERESTTRANDARSVASARAVAAWAARRSARSTTAATSSATTTIAPIAKAFSGWATESVYSGGVRKTLSSRPPPIAATSAGASPPIIAVTTVARKNSTTSVERSTDSRSATPSTVASTGSSTAAGQPHAWRRAGSERRGRRRASPASAWLTRWTSMLPDSAIVAAPIPGSTSRAHRERRDVPRTSWVAFAVRANSSSVAGTSSPTTVWNDASTSSARRRSSGPADPAGPVAARPSPRSTCTQSRSAEPLRRAIRAARRRTVALSGPPVTATTTRSRASQTSSTPSAVR